MQGTQSLLAEKHREHKRLIRMSHDPVLVLFHDSRALIANPTAWLKLEKPPFINKFVCALLRKYYATVSASARPFAKATSQDFAPYWRPQGACRTRED